MAFTVEDGTGIEGANAYVAVSFVDSYHSDRNNTAWADALTNEKEASIIKASEYIDKRFGRRFRGWRQLQRQGLEWPRISAYDDDGYLLDDVPFQIEKATAEYALRAFLCGVLAPDPIAPVPKQSLESGDTDRDTSGVITGELSRLKEKVGPLETDTTYSTRTTDASGSGSGGSRSVQSGLVNDYNIPEYPEADMWIEELLKSSASTSFVRS